MVTLLRRPAHALLLALALSALLLPFRRSAFPAPLSAEPPSLVAAAHADGRLLLVVEAPALDQEEPVTVTLSAADRVRQSVTFRLPASPTSRFHCVELPVGELPGKDAVIRCGYEGRFPEQKVLSVILLARAHETTLHASTELYAGSRASLHVGVHGVRSATQTTVIGPARARARLVTPDKRVLPLLDADLGPHGSANLSFDVPNVAPGNYRMEIHTSSLLGEETLVQGVRIESPVKVLLTTDRPMYQPGQSIHLRALALRAFDLKPAAHADLLLEILDPRGNRVFTRKLKTSAHGIAFADFVLADEITLGDYPIRARLGDTLAEKVVLVRRYTLPRFRAELKTDRTHYLPHDALQAELQADHFFGKPVAGGRVAVEAFVGDEEAKPFATWDGTTDAAGHASFSLPLPDLPDSTVRLEAKVTDSADHAETVTRSVPLYRHALQVTLLPEAGRIVPGLDNRIFVAALRPDGTPAQATVRLWQGREHRGKPLATLQTNAAGLAEFDLTPSLEQLEVTGWAARRIEVVGGALTQGLVPHRILTLTAEARDAAGHEVSTTASLPAEPAGENLLLRLDRALYQAGNPVEVNLHTSAGLPIAHLDVYRGGQLLLSRSLEVIDGRGRARVLLPTEAVGALEVHAQQILPSGELIRDVRVIHVSSANELRVGVRADKDTHRPGEQGLVHFQVTDRHGKPTPAALGVLIVDEAVYALQDVQPDLEKVYFTLQDELLRRSAAPAFEPAGGLPGLVRQPQVTSIQQLVAQILLGSLRPVRRPASWAVDPGAERRWKIEQQTQAIANAIFGRTLAGRPVVAQDERTGALRFRNNLLTELVRAEEIQKGDLIDPAGRPVTLASLLEREPGWTPEQLARAVTQRRLREIACGLETLWTYARDRHVRNGRFAPTPQSVRDALRVRGVPARWGQDAWGRPFHLISRTRHNDTGLSVLQHLDLVSAGPDGVLGTTDDLTCPADDRVPRGANWFLPEEQRQLRRNFWPGDPDAGRPFTLGRANLGMMLGGMQFGGMQFGGLPAAPGPGAPAPLAREEPARPGPALEPLAAPRVRASFPETLLWQPSLITDEHGQATLPIPFADSITSWRLSASATSSGGGLGHAVLPLRVFQDFFVEPDLPAALTRNDEVTFPVAVFNYLAEPQTVRLALDPAPWYELAGAEGGEQTLTLAPQEVTAARFRIRVKKVGHFSLTLQARGTRMSDAVKRPIEVVADEKLFEQVVGGRLQGTVEHEVNLPAGAIEGSPRLQVKLYPDVASQLLEGAEGMLTMPHGCFEQTSSSAYPNILIVDYLRRTRSAAPATLARAQEFLNAGYQRLLTFERPGGGFDLWGRGEPEVWLSALALREFTDMARVWPVEEAILARTRNWVLNRQEPDGGWSRPGDHEARGRLLLTSYVTWAILESTDRTPRWRASAERLRLQKAIDLIRTQAAASDDPYSLALAANALAAWDVKDADCRKLLERLHDLRKWVPEWDVIDFPGEKPSLTGAWGTSLTVETTALAVLALLRSGEYPRTCTRGLAYLVHARNSRGTWGSTQATVLALQALAASAGKENPPAVAAPFTIAVNGKEVARSEIRAGNADLLRTFDLREHLRTGVNRVTLSVKGEVASLYQVAAQYHAPETKKAAGERGSLPLDLVYDRTRLTMADVLKARARLRAPVKNPPYQVLVELPLPPGFTADHDQLRAWVDAGQVQRFDVTAGCITLYVNNLRAAGERTFEYALRPRYPLRARIPAALAYDYYTPAIRAATLPVDLVVEP